MTEIRPPWTNEEVVALNKFQSDGSWHPFTCPNDTSKSLIATKDGWVCPDKDYTQFWALDFMLEDSPETTI